MPGVRINFTRRGISTTVGTRGLHTTFGRDRVTNAVGLPGTGLSYSSTTRSTGASAARPSSGGGALTGIVLLGLASACFASHSPIAGALFVIFGVFFMLPLIARIARRLSGTAAALEAAEAAVRAETAVLLDRVRVLLFLARADGAVRSDERDLIVRYLRSQPGTEEADDAWLKQMQAQLPREPVEAIEVAAARLGHAGRIDEDFVTATEALVRLSKAISMVRLRTLTAVRRHAARHA